MAENWLADVRKYAGDADEAVVAAIVKYCGIALQSRDSSLVAMSDVKERTLVRENYLKKKLGLTDSDADLDAAVLSVGQVMKADRTKNRVTVYYLLAQHFGSLGLFGGASGSPATSAALAGGAAGLAAMMPAAAKASPSAATPPHLQGGGGKTRDDFNFVGWGCAIAALVLGAIIVAALLAWYADRPAADPAPAAAPAVTAVAPVVAPPPVIPEGAGVTAGERDGKPMLTVYFDTGKSDVTADLAAAAANVKAYAAANTGATLAVSGFNDPTGNAAANAELSKKRAQAVGKALEAAGIPAAAIELVRPDETTDTSGDNTAARRVEVTVK
jgi:outer membrane protein OmpA-like peptidoglycan-associated protein